jgi:hypothetical protein
MSHTNPSSPPPRRTPQITRLDRKRVAADSPSRTTRPSFSSHPGFARALLDARAVSSVERAAKSRGRTMARTAIDAAFVRVYEARLHASSGFVDRSAARLIQRVQDAVTACACVTASVDIEMQMMFDAVGKAPDMPLGAVPDATVMLADVKWAAMDATSRLTKCSTELRRNLTSWRASVLPIAACGTFSKSDSDGADGSETTDHLNE